MKTRKEKMMSGYEQRLVRFDWAIKNLLRDKANFDVLEGFLTCLLKEPITIVELLESESNQDDRSQKYNRVDLKCKDSKGQQIIVEVQSQSVDDYYERIAWGAAKALVESVDVGKPYFEAAKIISVSILFHDLYSPEKNTDYLYHGKTDITGCHTKQPLITEHSVTGKPITSGDIFPEFYIISVSNFHNEIREQLDEWVYLFKNEKTQDNFRSPGIDAAEKKLNYLTMSRKERQQYDAYRYNEGFTESAFATKHREGRAEGRAEGKAEGRAEGLAEGKKKGLTEGLAKGKGKGLAEGEKKAKLDSARKMLQGGVSADNIAQWIGLTLADVEQLR